MARKPKPATTEEKVNRTAEIIKSIGTILGVLGFLLALFPGLRLTITSLFSAQYEVGIGAMHGPQLEKLTGDQFYSYVWAQSGLRQAGNIFSVDGSIMPNVGGQPIPAYKPLTRSAQAMVGPGQCVYVHSLRFSFFKGDPNVSVGSVTEDELRKTNPRDPAGALLDRLPRDFNAPGCNPGSKDPAKACGAAAIWAKVTLVDCGTPK